MNANFVNVKVDREERPDVDKVYMSFVQALTGGGGWPMSVFLTPELKVSSSKAGTSHSHNVTTHRRGILSDKCQPKILCDVNTIHSTSP